MTLAILAAVAALIVLGSFATLFFAWVIVMGFKGAYDAGQLSRGMVIFGHTLEIIGLVIDVWCNLLACLVFLELSNLRREPTISQRLRRLVQTSGWRARLATWFAATLINPFAVGGPHIVIPAEAVA